MYVFTLLEETNYHPPAGVPGRHWDAKLAQLIRSCWWADPAGWPSVAAVLEQLGELPLHSAEKEQMDAVGVQSGSAPPPPPKLPPAAACSMC